MLHDPAFESRCGQELPGRHEPLAAMVRLPAIVISRESLQVSGRRSNPCEMCSWGLRTPRNPGNPALNCPVIAGSSFGRPIVRFQPVGNSKSVLLRQNRSPQNNYTAKALNHP